MGKSWQGAHASPGVCPSLQRAPLVEYAAFEAELNELRDQRTALSQRLAVLSTTAREMREGIRKLDVLERLQLLNPHVVPFSATDIRVAELTVVAAHLPLLIGKKGSQLREIESAAGVTLDVEHPKDEDGVRSSHARVRITGFESGIAAAEVLIAKVTEQVWMGSVALIGSGGKEDGARGRPQLETPLAAAPLQVDAEIPASEGLIHYLLARGGEAIRELEAAHAIRLHILREERAVAAHGLPESIASFRAALDELEGSKVTVSVDARSVAAVIGKSGANLKHLREAAAGVDIGIVRPEESAESGDAAGAGASAFHVYGRPELTAAAAASLRGLISELSESEEAHTIPSDALPWLVGRGGERIQAFQREAGVYARVVRNDDAAALTALPKSVATPAPGSALVIVRGNPAGLAKARPALAALLDEYSRTNASLLVTAEQGRLLVGIGGATVRKLRTETGCQIDVVEDSSAAEDRAAAKGAEEGSTAGDDAAAAPSGKDGQKAGGRRRGSRAVGAGEVAPPGHALVYVRGDADKVVAAVAAVRAHIQVRAGERRHSDEGVLFVWGATVGPAPATRALLCSPCRTSARLA